MNYTFFYGINDDKINITADVLNKCLIINNIYIPSGDLNRDNLFGDPVPFKIKYIFIKDSDGTIYKYSDKIGIHVDLLSSKITTEELIYPVIVAIAKLESDYIIEWTDYHLALGFSHIYIYDNEDVPTYKELLEDYSDKVTVIHLPGKNYHKPVQYYSLDLFISNYMRNGIITHVAHIDIDEFITLKKHASITDFIKEYIRDDCMGIGMNWRFFGDSGLTYNDGRPLTQRFINCEQNGNNHIKTLFDVNKTSGWSICHTVYKSEGFFVKSTNGSIIEEHLSDIPCYDIIQLNHYKSKTLSEFKYIRTRGRADLMNDPGEDILFDFNRFNISEVEDLTAYNFYNSINKYKLIDLTVYLNNKGYYEFEGYSRQLPEQIIDLINLSKGKKNVLEIGFNAGHSSSIFLENGCNVVSFDLGIHDYVKVAKEYIDKRFQTQHTLILGDSTVTVPTWDSKIKFDIIFIDGGHEYLVAKADLENCQRFAHENTIFIVDDITYLSEQSYTTKIWKEKIYSNTFNEIAHKEYSVGRGMSWGTLNLFIIVYYIFIPPDRNWKAVVEGQLNDLIVSGILEKSVLYIHICTSYENLLKDCKNFINCKVNCIISTSSENLYEYPGLKLLYDLSQKNPYSTLFYMHTKGMVFSCENKNTRNESEKILLRNTIYHHDKITEIFQNQSINKIGLFPSEHGSIWFNFFWIRASYLINKKAPNKIIDTRFDYEHYIGFDNQYYDDCYSLIKKSTCYYPQPEVVIFMNNLSNELIFVNNYFNKINYKFEYGSHINKINITEIVLNKCLHNNIIYIPNGELNRTELFGDPDIGTLKSIFINEREYPHYSNIIIDSFDKIYQIDQIPEYIKY
jgi:hypothetical protein